MCPYPGLRSYGGDDHDTFFGRECEVAECLEVLAAAGVLAVLGPSGSGKSSLVRAGVGAAIEQEGVPVVVVTPGAHPMDVITGLPGAGTGFVLVVDQCEEAMMLCKDPDERARFFDALVAHAERSRLIIALRADRLGEVSTYPIMARLVERGLYLLKPMVESNLRTAIEAPARQAGLLLEPGLVDVLVRDVEGEPGYLPLLSDALREIWERREGNTLTVAGYNASGGIREAVAQTAERVYEQAPAGQRPLLRDLLLRLVAPSPDGEPVRARVPRRLIAPDEEHEALVERLVEARLVTRDEDAVELSHEAVARAWPRLRSWLDDDLEGQRIWRHLAVAADNWDAMGRPESELYRGARLAQAVEWFRTTSPDVNSLEREFLQDGKQLATTERSALEDQMRRQTRVNRRLRFSLGGVALLVVVAIGALIVARGQATRADLQAVLARSNELAASAISVMEDDPSLAKLLALTAVTAGDTPTVEAMAALHQALISDHVTFRYGSTFDVGMVWADLDPSGDLFVLSGTGPVIGAGQVFEIVDTDTGGVQWSLDLSQNLPSHASAFVGSPFFTDDGRLLVSGTFWDPYGRLRLPIPFEGVDPPDPEILGAHIWEAKTGRLIDRYDLGRCGGIVVGISEDFLLAKTLSGDPVVLDECRWGAGQVGVQLVDRRTRETTLLTSSTDSPLTGAAMSGDGRRVAYDDGGEVVVIDVVSREEILRVEGLGVRDMNQDGSQLLVGDAPIQVWSVATGEVLARFDGHQGRSLFARFGPDETVLSTGDDGALRRWESTTGTEIFAYPGVGNGRPSFTGDGLVMVARPDRDTVTLLDTEVRGELGTIETCPGVVPANGLAGSGGTGSFSLVCDKGAAAKTYLLDVDRMVASPRTGISLALSPDGERYVTVDSNGSGALLVRNVADDEVATRLDGPSGNQVTGVRWSPDATMIAGVVDGGITVWNAPTGDVLYSEAGTRDGPDPVDIMFSPDSSFLVETTTGWTIRSVSTETWTTLIEHEVIADGGYQLGLAGFTPDGSSVLAVGAFRGNTAGALHWFDAETLQPSRSKINVHDGSITSMALDPEGSKLVTGSSDGMVR
ncbi:MAG TPA: hypothetical protein VLB67_10090, partial [Acidimicrobiia bacterium]|nr:hypothetical protein [Acidimicrobiia bacterium]